MAIKMDKTGIIVCSVVGSLGILSAIFGFSAEGTKLTPYTILVYGDECIYPSNPALGLAVCAAIFLLLAQITVSAVGGCCGCCKSRAIPSETKRIVGIICAVVSWIAAVVACVLLGEGASWNANVVRIGPAPFCPYLKDGILAGGGVLALVATALGITSFIMLRSQPAAPAADVVAVPVVPVAGAPSGSNGAQQLPAGVVVGHPQQYSPAEAKPTVQMPTTAEVVALGHQPQFPPKTQGYGQAQVAPTVSYAQGGYVHAPQFQPQGNGSYAPNQQFAPPPPPPPQGHQANTVAVAGGVQSFSPPQAVVYAQPQPQHPARPQASYSPQHPARPQAYVQVPVPTVAASQAAGSGEEAGAQTGIRTEDLFKAGAKLLMGVAENALSSEDNTAASGDIVLPSMGDDPTTQDAGGEASPQNTLVPVSIYS